MIFHGPILTQVGMKPLYRAGSPSFLIVCTAQSRLPLYSFGVAAAVTTPFIVMLTGRWFIRRVCKKE